VEIEQANRQEELDHMDEILARYDKASAEREKVLEVMRERIRVVPSWMPGDDESLKGGIERDEQYTSARTREEYLNSVMKNALSDVRKIFVARGVVSEYHTKGRKGV
jgi:uncharacterized protein (UPF0305 family)